MIVTLQHGTDPESVRKALVGLGQWPVRHDGRNGETCFVLSRFSSHPQVEQLLAIPGVADVAVTASRHPLVDRQAGAVVLGHNARGAIAVGPSRPACLMAGPCSAESAEHVLAEAQRLARLGIEVLRGGAFKPRSSPYAFQGHGLEALEWLRAGADAHDMLLVTEALSESSAEAVGQAADVVQIGSRNMHDYALLKRVARAGKPVLLKRGMSATVDEWLMAGEYCLLHGATGVVFCERGIRSFDPQTRNVLDLGAVALLAETYRVPVVVDPSHAAGRRDLIAPLARAAIGAGAHGLLIETHLCPSESLSDGPQALDPERLAALVRELASSGSHSAPAQAAASDNV